MPDTVNGTPGNDTIDASYVDAQGDRVGPGDDVVVALGGNDTVFAGGGDDSVDGGHDDDRLYGGEGDDALEGGAGQDILWGEAGADSLSGGEGGDTLKGGEGGDTLAGGEGADWLDGQADRDVIRGGAGDLLVSGGSEGDDFDVLDLRGLPPYRLDITGPDGNGNGFNGAVVFLDPHGNPTGESFQFTEIEDILRDPPQPKLDGTVEGTRGDDLIDLGYTGDPEGDRVDAGDAILAGAAPNDDLVYAFAGDDTVFAGEGDDVIFGGAGNDTLHGERGDDTIFGNTGDDTSYGGAGNDSFQDSLGSDTIFGGSGDDIIRLSEGGAANRDSVLGGTGSDTIFGGRGDDVIDSSNGGIGLFDNPYPPLPADANPFNDRDVVFGGLGDDAIRTGDDRDTIAGGAGDDRLDAGIDDDSVRGDAGDDTIVGGEGADVISGGAGGDTIYGGLDPSFPDSLNIPNDGSGPFGPDLVPAANGADVIFGGAGDDVVFGLDDDDTIFGGAGVDSLDGGVDADTVVGGDGGDSVDGGSAGDDFDRLDLTGSGVDFITYTSPDREDGIVTFNDGSTMTFVEIENVIPCFTPGTAIATPRGERLVEELREGDRIITRDNGIQEIRWVGRRDLSAKGLLAAPHLRPVLVKAGSLGHGLPERDMLVSPNHRVLVANDRTQLYFEESEVLAAAKHMVGAPGIHQVEVVHVTYIHFMFDRHEVVLSNGAWTESFQPGDWSLKGIAADQRKELLELFPELRTPEGIEGYQAARKSLKRHEAQLLAR